MIHHFNVSGQDRKNLVKAISEYLCIGSKYLGAPTFAYQVGTYTISKDGALSWSDLDDADPAHMEESCSLIQALEVAGFHSEEADYFAEQEAAIEEQREMEPQHIETTDNGAEGTVSIRIPLSSMSETALVNLKALLQAKGPLIKKALDGGHILPVLWDDDGCIDFPWLPSDTHPDTINAWMHFISALCEMARNAHRVSAKEKEIANEKYEFRCFLLRLGMIGDEYKQVRKILLKNLSGSAAFKSPVAKGGEQA